MMVAVHGTICDGWKSEGKDGRAPCSEFASKGAIPNNVASERLLILVKWKKGKYSGGKDGRRHFGKFRQPTADW